MWDITFFAISIALVAALLFGQYIERHNISKYKWAIFSLFPINFLPIFLFYYVIEWFLCLLSYHSCPIIYEMNSQSLLKLISDDNFVSLCYTLYALSIIYKCLYHICSLPYNYNISLSIANLNAAVYILLKPIIKKLSGSVLWSITSLIFISHIEEFGYKRIDIASGTSNYLSVIYIAYSEIFFCFWCGLNNWEESFFPFFYVVYSVFFEICVVREFFWFLKSNFFLLSECPDNFKKLILQKYEIKEIEAKLIEVYSFAIYLCSSLFLAYYFIDDIWPDFWVFKEFLYFAGWACAAALANPPSLFSSERNFTLNTFGFYFQFLILRRIKHWISQ
ncbi:unnamed protein product [Blepharisma stoltei]|uniref:Uncharacterized protein n=1 Tax=Blepharisma stoltei TaxID=1481888 RepID=A0AAU9IYG1_9CILI|nr:unnamed protein product [Blepharisma stoltei]